MLTRTCAAVVVALAGFAAPALGQSDPDPILAGYRLLHNGDKGAAVRHFESLITDRPDDLAARFGALFARESRLNVDRSDLGPFEQALDAFIDLADKRYKRSKQDAQALLSRPGTHAARYVPLRAQ